MNTMGDNDSEEMTVAVAEAEDHVDGVRGYLQ